MRRVTRAAGALALAAVLAGAVPGPAAHGQAPTARAVDRSVTATPAGTLRSTTLAVDPVATARRAGAPIEVAVGAGTQMVGVSWAGGDEVEVQVSVPEGDGWGPWADLHHDGPDGDPVGGRTGVGPAWLGPAGVDRIAVRVVAGAPSDLRVEAMSFAASRTARAVTVDQPATPAGGPDIATRASWAPGGWQGGRAGCTPAPVVMGALRFAVVHHTDGTNTYGAGDVPGILAGIYRFHTATNGWCDIAYNLFVDRFGTVWEGRSGGIGSPVMGSHAKGFNTDSVGVALLGSYGGTAPSAAALTALRDVLAWKLGSHGVDPVAQVSIVSGGSPRYPAGQSVVLPTVQGHRDSGLTACPGERLYERLPGLRTDVADRFAATNVASTWSPSTTGAAFFGRIEDAVAGRPVPNGRVGRYTSLVTRGGSSRNALAAALVLSSATEVRVGGPDRLYRAAFGREAETDGLRYWVGRRDGGLTLSSMARLFSGTPEFRAAYDGLADTAFVTAIYRNILGRDPEAAGRDYWVGRLADGLARHQLLAQFSESAEHTARTRVGGTISRAYFVLLDRAATASERATWTDAFADGAPDSAVVALLLSSSEYAAGA